MERVKILLLILFLSSTLESYAQIEVVHHLIINNDTSIRDLTKSTTTKSVIFFCPTAKINQDIWFKKAEDLQRNYKLKDLTDLTLYFVYFKQDTKNNSKGVKYIPDDTTKTMFIGQFECLFSGFEIDLLFRAKNKMKYNYDIQNVFNSQSIFSIPIVDTNKCFEKMQDRIPFYADIIRESCKPNYSTDEKMQFLRDSVLILYKNTILLQTQIDSLREEFNQFKLQITVSDKIDEKSSKKNKGTKNTSVENQAKKEDE